MKTYVKLAISCITPLFILMLPPEAIPLDKITLVEQRVIAIFVMATLFWILEPIPIYATSLLIILLELIMVSDKGFVSFVSQGAAPLGELLSYKAIMATFASPIILLFLGGFFLAMAATKYRLDQNLARVMLRPFGKKPAWVMMGLMGITAVFSMFMSNTATTAMMLSLLAPVLAVFDEGDRGKIAFVLCIPVAANIGGIATPIGTPPNAVALKYLTGEHSISFGKWMTFAFPYVLILLGIAWVLLWKLYPTQTPSLNLNIKGKFLKSAKAKIVYATFAGTVLLWLTDFLHGMNSYIVAMIPVGVFSATGIITKEDLKNISWDVLWLVSGGIALGLALDKSGLAVNIIQNIPFEEFSPFVIIVGTALLATLMANFMSNTATANLLLPIVAALGTSLQSLVPLGGVMMLILSVTMSCSLGMSLPVSTPPNALAHGTGLLASKDLTKTGISLGIIGLFLIFGLMYLLNTVQFFH
ncbi:SLC13 family permease [Rapidithrix thailandica]|uniref:SLC13 family permease n=1 Tax=Rapidithrix thailandica TaxID=413964 RepID=A0AAW9S1K1_9BACT